MKHGSLCTGYGGIDLAVEQVLGATTAWVSDVDKGANKLLAHRFPGVPNIGDMTAVDWSQVEPVDIISGGYPCQPFSHAGKRKGRDDERHLWPYVREAIRVLRPQLTVLENVAGHRSLGFDRVLGDLAEDGMHVRWTSVRASEVGAPHHRERLFILITPAESPDLGHEWVGRSWGLTLTDAVVRTEMGTRDNPRLLPTPKATNNENRGSARFDPRGTKNFHALVHGHEQWGKYADAIARWEHLTREAPAPTEPGRNGNPRLSPAFTEWLMGLPAGWITDVPGITRNEALRLCGNGVVPQQCAAALTHLLELNLATQETA